MILITLNQREFCLTKIKFILIKTAKEESETFFIKYFKIWSIVLETKNLQQINMYNGICNTSINLRNISKFCHHILYIFFSFMFSKTFSTPYVILPIVSHSTLIKSIKRALKCFALMLVAAHISYTLRITQTLAV